MDFKFRPIHPFPARMAPSIALNELATTNKRRLRVLDPMAGSGTTLVVARKFGHFAIGFDSDPLAVLISHAWCADFSPEELSKQAHTILEQAQCSWETIPTSEAFPDGSDEQTRDFVQFWFDATNRRQLTVLSRLIQNLKNNNIKKILLCAFSKMIITKKIGVSLAMDISHSRPHKVYDRAPINAIDIFMKTIQKLIFSLPFNKNISNNPKVKISRGDSRNLPLDDNCVDIVITSPPYLNAIDYIRASKFSLVWMGYQIKDLQKLRSFSIGADSLIASKHNNLLIPDVLSKMGNISLLPLHQLQILKRYVCDIDLVVQEIKRVVVPKGEIIFVIGDSTIRKVFIENSKAILHIAKNHGLKLKSMHKRQIPDNLRYLPPPSSLAAGHLLQRRMREEVVINFQKSR